MLVSQFSQPLAFLRELVQNSLDAGTNRVDVRVSWNEAEGCAVAEVSDTGEGMDRACIDEKLTRLFASSKAGDLTKIGKFGVGFVSVFAVRPQAVVVDTGRGGEAWRLVFNPDRSFDRNRLDQPHDGTRVSVFVKMAQAEFPKFERDCRETVTFWCRHCDVEVLFNGSNVVEPFRLPGGFQLEHEEQGTHVVVAPSGDKRPFYGFYNRGLTLLEGPGSPVAGVTFKCRSRYLEHTITRDNVLQDEHYHKALAVVARAAYRLLPARLAQQDPPLWDVLALVGRFPDHPPELLDAPLVPGLTRQYSLRELKKGPVFRAEDDGLLARTVDAAILLEVPAALAAFGVEVPELDRFYDLAEAVKAPELTGLLAGAQRLLPGFQVVPARLHPDREDRLSLRCVKLGQPLSGPAQGKLLAIEAAHPWLTSLQTIAEHDPGLAAFLLAQHLMLTHQLPLQTSALASALKHRKPPITPLPEPTAK